MKWDPRWSLYLAILLSGYLMGIKDVNETHKDYKIDSYTQSVIIFHYIVIMYMILGLFFYEKSDIIGHIIVTSTIILLWSFNSHCILTMYVEKHVDYSEEDYDRIVMRNPERLRMVFQYLIPGLAVSAFKLALLNG